MKWDRRVKIGASQVLLVLIVLFFIWIAQIITKLETALMESSKPRGQRLRSHYMLITFSVGSISRSQEAGAGSFCR